MTFRRHAGQPEATSATYNEGIEWAGGDYLLLLSADDYLLPEFAASAPLALMEQRRSASPSASAMRC